MSTQAQSAGSAPWYHQIDSSGQRAFWASFLGYMLDAMDFLMFSLVLIPLLEYFHLNSATVALVGSTSLAAAAIGGIFFGWLADRIGRKRCLIYTLLIYCLFSALTATSQTVWQLVLWRALLGIGMGGEWATGGALLMESWPAEQRGKASAFLQAAWPIGYLAAAGVTALVFPIWGWRGIFLVGVLPALLTIWMRRGVEEPAVFRERDKTQQSNWTEMFSPHLIRNTLVGGALLITGVLAYYSVFFWMPGYLSSPVSKGGAGMSVVHTAEWVILMQIAGLVAEASFGFFADRFGRKATYIVNVALAAICVAIWSQVARDPTWLFIFGILVGGFGSSYFSAFPVVLAELFPTRVRTSGMGLIFNIGRGVGSFGAPLVGFLALSVGVGSAIGGMVVFYLLTIVAMLFISETKALRFTS